MPPNNTNSPKSNEAVEISLTLKEKCPAKRHSKKEISIGKILANGFGHSKSQTNVKTVERPAGQEGGGPQRNRSVCSLMDELLCDIYSKMEVKRRTSATTCDFSWQDSDTSRRPRNELRSSLYWGSKDLTFLRAKKIHLEKLVAEEGNDLVKQLKRKNFLLMKREAHYDVITAYIQAVSTKTREDTKMKFSLTPGAETGFSQWLDAMKMVAQLPGGMPSEFRTKLWLQLSEKHLDDQNVDWEKAESVIFNEWTNPDDEELGIQIVKDLHRTGCSLFCGEQEHNQALLKRVLLAYARWNKNVGYCQGFNMLAALILQVMDKNERNAVKVMIYLIEGVLPESYFANNLRGLSVDMAVFRDLLRLRLPKLSKHLEALQHDTNAGTSYEPPLTNVFTMQWFLTLFSNCLPQQTVLRVWDLVFLYGNEVLLRTALAIWGILQDRVITVESADEFYSIMGVVTREMLEFGLMDANTLVKMIAMVDPFPNELQELRDKYLYNISPWTQSVQSAAKKGIRLFYSDPDDQDDTEDEDKIALATAYGVFRRRESTSKELQVSGPTLDISVLKQQYAKLRQRQRQAHVIITAACSSNLNLAAGPSVSVNHLLMGKSALINKGRRIGPPEGSIPPRNNKKEHDKEEKRPKTVISGETFYWKDEEKEMMLKSQNKSESNKKVVQENEKNRLKVEEEEGRLKTNHDRTEEASEKSVEESLRKKAESNGSSSSSSSTSTELCDEEIHRYTDFDSDDATPSNSSGYHIKEISPPRFLRNSKIMENSGCDNDNLKEIKNLAVNLVNEIEEKIQTSEKLMEVQDFERREGRQRNSGESPFNVTNGNFDNTKLTFLDNDILILCDNILKSEPEVPTCDYVIKETEMAITKAKEEEGFVREKFRRKSDLGLNIIRENLEMLNKFSQKSVRKTESRSSEITKTSEETKIEDVTCFNEQMQMKTKSEGEKDFILPIFSDTDVQKFSKTDPREPARTIKNFFVEKAISPMEENSLKTIKINKEVNTELTFGVGEVEISTKQSKLQKENESAFKFDTFRDLKEILIPTTSRKSREAIFREKDEIKQRIETSKSDWELKMRKIAELETTTRETLNEIQARSMHRKSLHRSLDRSTKRTYLGELKPKSPEKSSVPRIQLESSNSTEGESSHQRMKISALSFDEITSRTEKLLGMMDFNRSTEETLYNRSLAPEFSMRKTKDSISKCKELVGKNYGEGSEMKTSSKMYEFFSSPTSPDHRARWNVEYSDYLSPRKYPEESKEKCEDDLSRITQNDCKIDAELFERKQSPERRKPEMELEPHLSRTNFNPFPTRSVSKPKKLGVKLGLYPTSPEIQTKKS